MRKVGNVPTGAWRNLQMPTDVGQGKVFISRDMSNRARAERSATKKLLQRLKDMHPMHTFSLTGGTLAINCRPCARVQISEPRNPVLKWFAPAGDLTGLSKDEVANALAFATDPENATSQWESVPCL